MSINNCNFLKNNKIFVNVSIFVLSTLESNVTFCILSLFQTHRDKKQKKNKTFSKNTECVKK